VLSSGNATPRPVYTRCSDVVGVTGAAGAISSSNLISYTGVRNVGLVRPRDVGRDIRVVRPAR